MKVVILAGGYGSRLGSLTGTTPKPMLEIGGKPILWHIMKYYSSFGFNEFVILAGYKANVIKNYFINFRAFHDNFTIDMASGEIQYHGDGSNEMEKWKVSILDTGVENLKGSRIKQAEKLLKGEPFFLTYGDGVANIDIHAQLKFHKEHAKLITLSGVHPPSRFGELITENGLVKSFEEKPQLSNAGLINGGYMICQPELLNHLSLDPTCDFEFGPLEQLAKKGEVMMYEHPGFWECVDTERDLNHMNSLWSSGKATWKIW